MDDPLHHARTERRRARLTLPVIDRKPVLKIPRPTLGIAKIAQGGAPDFNGLYKNLAHGISQILQRLLGLVRLGQQASRLDRRQDMGPMQRFGDIDIAQPRHHPLIEQRRLYRRLLALKGRGHFPGIEIIAQRLRAQPLQIGTVLFALENIQKPKPPGIGINQMALAMIGVVDGKNQMVMLGLGARLIIARRLVDAVFGKTPGAGHAQMAQNRQPIIEPDEQIFRPPPHPRHRRAGDRIGQPLGKWKAQIGAPQLHPFDFRLHEPGLKTAADRFDLWQFGHEKSP